MWMRDVVTLTNPLIFIAENVKGLANLDDVKEIIEKDFSQAGNGGYLVVPAVVLHAADYGVPQNRERIIFFGFRKNALTKKAFQELSQSTICEEYNPYPPKTHSYTVSQSENLYTPVTCAEVFIDLLEPTESEDLSQQKYSRAKYMGKHCQGQSEIKLDNNLLR
jgi:DNA (cytosine-5)-methyltransferase 1